MARLEEFPIDSLPEELQQTGEGFVQLENKDGQALFDWLTIKEQSRSENAARFGGRAALSGAGVILKVSRKHGDASVTFIYAE